MVYNPDVIRFLACVVLVVLALWTSRASAQDVQSSCFNAAVKGQELRKAGKLMEARTQFVACARETCPAEVTGRCSTWIIEVDEAIPSVIVVAQDAAGHELGAGAVVRVDGAPIDIAHAIKLPPGPHTFALEAIGQQPVQETVTLREGERGRQVVLRLAAMPGDGHEELPKKPISHTSPMPWILASVGLVGAASFGAFAIAGTVDRSQSHCDVGCGSSDASRVRAELLVADISLGVAVAFGVIAVIDWLVLRGSASHAISASLVHLSF